MGHLIAVVILFFLMICESGGFVLALIIYGIGFLALMFWPESKSESVSKKRLRNSSGSNCLKDTFYEDDIMGGPGTYGLANYNRYGSFHYHGDSDGE